MDIRENGESKSAIWHKIKKQKEKYLITFCKIDYNKKRLVFFYKKATESAGKILVLSVCKDKEKSNREC